MLMNILIKEKLLDTYYNCKMETRFSKKFNCFCSINTKFQDFKLVHPINKIIKPSQLYFDSQNSPELTNSYTRTLSQEPKIRNSIVLEPLSPKAEGFSLSSRAVSIERPRRNLKIPQHKSSHNEEYLKSIDRTPRKFIDRTPKVNYGFIQW